MKSYWIIITDFRPCMISLSNSQAIFCYYTITVLLPSVRLRYYLGGHRPSETTNYTLS